MTEENLDVHTMLIERKIKEIPDDYQVEFQKIFDMIPEIECKNKCWNQCTELTMVFDIENKVLHDELKKQGKKFVAMADTSRFLFKRLENKRTKTESKACPYLTKDNLCSVHEFKPFGCKLWGAVKGECPYDCKPKEGQHYLTEKEEAKILSMIRELVGKEVFDKGVEAFRIQDVIMWRGMF